VVSDGRGLAEAGGADVILATSNAYAPVTDAIQALRPDGRLVLMGVAHEPFSVPTSIMWVRGRILGSSQNSPEHLYEALDYAARGKVRVMAETYPLSDIARAYDRVKAGAVRFRAVIVP
jgi:D-arabinose 1-dehydrogenase-like Zn-dependent alcohol dehydrogenase